MASHRCLWIGRQLCCRLIPQSLKLLASLSRKSWTAQVGESSTMNSPPRALFRKIFTFFNVPCAGTSHVNFFILDVEGSELDVLRTVDWRRTSFDVIVVETDKAYRPEGYQDRVTSFLRDRGYVHVRDKGRNSWYQRRDFEPSRRPRCCPVAPFNRHGDWRVFAMGLLKIEKWAFWSFRSWVRPAEPDIFVWYRGGVDTVKNWSAISDVVIEFENFNRSKPSP